MTMEVATVVGSMAWMYGLTVVGFVLWFSHGLMLGQGPLIFTNGVCLLPSAFLFMMEVLLCKVRDAVADMLDPAVHGDAAFKQINRRMIAETGFNSKLK